MAELGAAAIGMAATMGAALYTAASGFIARHENTHSLQVTEIRRHIADFDAAYAQGEVTEDDWRTYLAIRNEARTTESDYEECIETYRRTPTYDFVAKWKKRRQVRKRKKALRMANRSLRSHYYDSTSSASDASSITAESGSPPQSRRSPAHSDDERILSWAEGVRVSKSQSDLNLTSLEFDPDPDEDDEQWFKLAPVERDRSLSASERFIRDVRHPFEDVLSRPSSQAQGQVEAKNVLTTKTPKKVNASLGVVASVNPSMTKPLIHGGVAAAMRANQLADGLGADNSAVAKVEAMQAELKRLDEFLRLWARNIVTWGEMISKAMLSLRNWALSFAKVIGLSAELRSEVFDAVTELVEKALLPLASGVEVAITEQLLKDLADLMTSMVHPRKLLASMNAQEPFHYCLLTMPVSGKHRPPPSLLAASTNYLALRGQLAEELPIYIALMHRALAGLARKFANIQARFWIDVKNHWTGLWEMLRLEDDSNVGSAETISLWYGRWADVNEVVTNLGLTIPVQVETTPPAMGPSPNSSPNKSAASPESQLLAAPQPPTASQRHSLVSQPAKYICEVVCECKPPISVSYNSFPFFTLRMGEFYDILQEAGHPNIHPELPLHLDDEEDCLLLCRNGNGLVGWALASFLVPLSLGS